MNQSLDHMRVAIGQFHALDPEILTFASQLGVTSVQMNTPIIPGAGRWEYEDLRLLVDTCAEYGLMLEAVENVPRSFYDKVMFGQPGRDEQIENYCYTIRNVGRAGIRFLGHHFTPNYVWRTSFATPGRGGAEVASFDLASVEASGNVMIYRVDEKVGSHTPIQHQLVDPYVAEAKMWENYAYFLRAVLPVAEEAGVKLALHPADPPISGVGGATRLFRSVESFKRAAEIADSDAWGLNLCLGCCSEMPGGAANVFQMIEHFGRTKKIFYVHFRDVRGTVPEFQECFLGEGNYDPAEALLALERVGFTGFLLDDHVPKMVNDSHWGHRSRGYAVGYMQGLLRMLVAARSLRQ